MDVSGHRAAPFTVYSIKCEKLPFSYQTEIIGNYNFNSMSFTYSMHSSKIIASSSGNLNETTRHIWLFDPNQCAIWWTPFQSGRRKKNSFSFKSQRLSWFVFVQNVVKLLPCFEIFKILSQKSVTITPTVAECGIFPCIPSTQFIPNVSRRLPISTVQTFKPIYLPSEIHSNH